MTTTSTDTPGPEADRVSFDRNALGLRTATPGMVVAVSADGTTVDVQPAISMTQRLESTVEVRLPIVRGVPLAVLGSKAQGLFVCVPVSVGDEGTLVVCDRALDNWQHGGGVSVPPDMASPRHHDITDSVFFPGLQRLADSIPGFPTDAVEVRNLAGTVKASVSADTVKLLAAGGSVTVDASSVKAETPGASVMLTAAAIAATAGGAALALGAGVCSLTGNFMINGQPYLGHTHNYTDDGTPMVTAGVNP